MEMNKDYHLVCLPIPRFEGFEFDRFDRLIHKKDFFYFTCEQAKLWPSPYSDKRLREYNPTKTGIIPKEWEEFVFIYKEAE